MKSMRTFEEEIDFDALMAQDEEFEGSEYQAACQEAEQVEIE